MSEKTYTVSDLMEHNKCSRSWILNCILTGRIPEPDEKIGKNSRIAVWHTLHTIAGKEEGNHDKK